jgi:hypothetical protein
MKGYNMKAIDGTKLLVAIVLLAASTNILANSPKPLKPFEDKCIKQVVYSIDNSIPAIVESQIRVALELKNSYPNENLSKVVDKLDDLASNGASASIRYKAQLARIYFNYFNQFKDLDTSNSENPEQIFRMIANRIESNTFAAN